MIIAMRFLALLVALAMPLHAFAATAIQRDDAFKIIWDSIRRPALDTRETPFTDVPKTHAAFKEITYAKSRGIIDDGEAFQPDAELSLQDAILWLMRTRNVDDPDQLVAANLNALLARYPLAATGADLTHAVTQDELMTLLSRFDTMLLEEIHESSLYSEKFHGKGTAFGEAFDMYAMTAAHRTFPYNTLVKVTNIANGKSVTVRINDRGPFVKGRDMDLSLGAFTSIAERSLGKINVTFQRMGDVNLVGDCAAQPKYQQRVNRSTVLDPGMPHVTRLGDVISIRSKQAFVVRKVSYPGGGSQMPQDWVLPGETYTFNPSLAGEYVFLIGAKDGRGRQMTTRVVECKAA